jgi:hypothetical protein
MGQVGEKGAPSDIFRLLSGAPLAKVWTSTSSYPGVAAHIIMGWRAVGEHARDRCKKQAEEVEETQT